MSTAPVPTPTSIPTSLPAGALHLTHLSPSTWPLPSASPSPSPAATSSSSSSSNSQTSPHTPIHICVLDSSFNPPTLAHLALASSVPPPSLAASAGPYTARLLLFSLRNVDKRPQPSDPTLEQRLAMVHLLASRMTDLPIAVGVLDEPTFAGKSLVVHNYLRRLMATATRMPDTHTDTAAATTTATGTATVTAMDIATDMSLQQPPVHLTFLIGTDTLTRFFEPRYYASASDNGGMPGVLRRFFADPPDGQGSSIVAARRGGSHQDRTVEDAVLASDEAKPWAQEGKVSLLGRGDEAWVGTSSTRVREAVKRGDLAELQSLVPSETAQYVLQQGLYR